MVHRSQRPSAVTIVPKSTNRLLLISVHHDGVRGALAERNQNAWRVTNETTARGSWLAALDDVLGILRSQVVVKDVIVITPQCRTLLLNQTVPPQLTNEQANEMLRWEVDSVLATHEDLDIGFTDHEATLKTEDERRWETGYVKSGTHQTAVAAIKRYERRQLQQDVQDRGLSLLAIIPTLSTGWASLAQTGTAVNGAIAIAQHTGNQATLSIFEQGRMEFNTTYAAFPEAWPKNLIADVKSFPVKKLLLLNEPEQEVLNSIPGMITPEAVPTDWLWTSALLASGTQPAAQTPQSIPVLSCTEPPMPLWKSPAIWWLATCVVLTFMVLSKAIGWISEFRELRSTLTALDQETSLTIERLKAFEADATEYAILEQQLKSTQAQIASAQQEAEKPGRAKCAQIDYASDALRSIALAFSGKVKLQGFKTDYKGRIFVQGQSANDAVALNALSDFYEMMDEYPVASSVMSTTKEGAPQGKILFMADEQNTAVAKAKYAARVMAAQEQSSETLTLVDPNLKVKAQQNNTGANAEQNQQQQQQPQALHQAEAAAQPATVQPTAPAPDNTTAQVMPGQHMPHNTAMAPYPMQMPMPPPPMMVTPGTRMPNNTVIRETRTLREDRSENRERRRSRDNNEVVESSR